MVKRALALEAANETVDKIRGKSGEGSSDRKRKYESGNAPKVQQVAKKAGKAPLPVDSRPKAVDRRMLSRTQITGTVCSCRQGKTLTAVSKTPPLQLLIRRSEACSGHLPRQGGSWNIEKGIPDLDLLWRLLKNLGEGNLESFLGLPKESITNPFNPFGEFLKGNSVCVPAQTGTWRQCLDAKISSVRPAILPSISLNGQTLPPSSSVQNSELFCLKGLSLLKPIVVIYKLAIMVCDDPHYIGTVIPTHVGIVKVITVGHLPKHYHMIEIYTNIDTESRK
ncbi:hypothetical protein Taro_042444 [Colocasia esculenta]|uniref:Uncharacterized protein n=1 Tax=Colocasia esculenta TaxID=4460 RepID=A0A843WWI4_COLES|nr:hypothetical protein [Colocasia esculenta]